jgi:hypothetical protein
MGRKIDFIILSKDRGLNTTDTGARFSTTLPKNRMRIQRLYVVDTSPRSQKRFLLLDNMTGETSPELYEPVLNFGCLQEFLILEKHAEN